MSLLPTDSAARKAIPVFSGVFQYFPAALAEVAKRSKDGNDKHSPGKPLRWVRDKSNDHLDCLARHLLEGDLVGVAWRALAALQLECEAKGAPIAPGAWGEMTKAWIEETLAANGKPDPMFPSVGTRTRVLTDDGWRVIFTPYSVECTSPHPLDPVAAEWQDSHGAPANPVKQTDEE